MSFLLEALKIQNEIQNLPLETIGFQDFESRQQSSVRIASLIDSHSKGLQVSLQSRLRDEFQGMGPIAPLMQDESVTEIIVNSVTDIWFEKNGKLLRLEDRFASELTFQNFIERICQEAKVQISVERPYCDGLYKDFRLHLISGHLTRNSQVLTLRRQSRSPWTLSKLLDAGWCQPQGAGILRDWICNRRNFLVVGETGSGKTSVLNACLQELPENDRVVILEDTPELKPPNPASVRLLTRIDSHGLLPAVDLTELVRQSLRMRPDRLVVGEVRGGEAKDLLLALSTGHQGSLGTLHASSASQALMRLEMLVQLGAPHWSLQTIRRLLGLSLNGIVVVGRSPWGERKLKALYELSGVEDTGILLDLIYQED